MASRRRRVLADEASKTVAEWRSSGEPLRSWCARQGIDGRSLRYWVDRESPETVLRLLEVTPARRAAGFGIRLRVEGVTIAVGDDFSDEVLTRVIRAVRAC